MKNEIDYQVNIALDELLNKLNGLTIVGIINGEKMVKLTKVKDIIIKYKFEYNNKNVSN